MITHWQTSLGIKYTTSRYWVLVCSLTAGEGELEDLNVQPEQPRRLRLRDLVNHVRASKIATLEKVQVADSSSSITYREPDGEILPQFLSAHYCYIVPKWFTRSIYH